MAGWTDGYFTEVQYTANVFPHLAPGLITFACLRQGVRPPALGPGATYLELGCGQGVSLNMAAAANPAMRFVGVDFNPAQIANAQRLADAAGLDNVTFEDLSFAQVLELPEGRIPKCEIIALHGVYSWVSPENRGFIVRILDRLLKPGGLAAISYNALPGWGPLLPLRDFVKAYVDRAPGPAETEVVAAFRAAQQMLEANARYFGHTPQAKALVERALKSSPAYLIHEHLNAHLHPLYHAEVVRELAEARLTYAAAAAIEEDLLSLAVADPLAATIEAATDPVWRETLLDYSLDRQFRSDIFVRGRNALNPHERLALLHDVGFALARPAGRISFEFKVPRGALTGDPAVYGAIVGALAEAPRSFAELAALPALANTAAAALLKALGLLISARAIHPTVAFEQDAGAARAMNRVLLQRFVAGEGARHVAAPAIGAAAAVDFTDLLGLAALDRGLDRRAAARLGAEILSRGGAALQKDGRALTARTAQEAELADRLAAFETESLPVLRGLGVVAR